MYLKQCLPLRPQSGPACAGSVCSDAGHTCARAPAGVPASPSRGALCAWRHHHARPAAILRQGPPCCGAVLASDARSLAEPWPGRCVRQRLPMAHGVSVPVTVFPSPFKARDLASAMRSTPGAAAVIWGMLSSGCWDGVVLDTCMHCRCDSAEPGRSSRGAVHGRRSTVISAAACRCL